MHVLHVFLRCGRGPDWGVCGRSRSSREGVVVNCEPGFGLGTGDWGWGLGMMHDELGV